MKTWAELMVSMAARISAKSTSRGEQWRADLRDAREAGFSEGAVALGALRAALSETSPRRVGGFADGVAIPRTSIALVGVTLAAMYGSVLLATLLARSSGGALAMAGLVVILGLAVVVAPMSFGAAVFAVVGATGRRAIAAISLAAGGTALFGAGLTSLLGGSLSVGAGAFFALAAWLFVTPGNAWKWWLLAAPICAAVAAETGSVQVLQMLDTPETTLALTNWLMRSLPAIAAVLAGLVVSVAPLSLKPVGRSV